MLSLETHRGGHSGREKWWWKFSRTSTTRVSHPFLKLFSTFFPDPTEHPQVSKDDTLPNHQLLLEASFVSYLLLKALWSVVSG